METGHIPEGAVKESGPLGFLEAPVVGIISKIPSPRLKAFGQAFFRPVDTFNELKAESSPRNYIINFALAGLVGWVGMLIGMAFLLIMMESFANVLAASPMQMLGEAISTALFALLAFPLIAILSGIIASAVYFIIAKLLGGSGSFTNQTFAFSLIVGASSLVLLPFHMLFAIPFVGLLMFPISFALAIYVFYLYYKIIRNIHGLSNGKAIAVLAIPIAIAILLVVVLMGIALAGLFSVVASNPAIQSEVKITQSDSYWQEDARPFAILGHSIGANGKGSIILQNVDTFSDTLTLTSLRIGKSGGATGSFAFAPGETKEITITGADTGAAGDAYKLGVVITYDTTNLKGLKQYGAKDLAGKYT